MTVLLTNNVSTTLAASIAAGDATFNVVDGNRFPSPTTGQYAYATIIAPNGAVEIVKITSRTGNALGVVRAQEGTTAQVFPAGSRVELRVTAGSILDAVADGVAEFDADIAALDLRLDTAEAELISLDGRLDTAEGDITALEGRMTTAEGDITTIEGDIVALEAFDTALATSTGSTSVGFLQAGTGASLRTVQSKLRDFLSVKDFGAVGDGVADDTTAIQNAITFSRAQGGESRKLYWPRGTYKITNTITVGTNQYVEFDPGVTVNFIAADPLNTPLFTAANQSEVYFCGNGAVLNGTRGSVAGQGGGTAFFLYGSDNITIRNFVINNFATDGITITGDVTGSGPCQNVLIENCYVNNCRRNGMSIISVRGCVVIGGEYNSTNGALSGPWAGIDIEPNVDCFIEDVTLIGVNTLANDGAGIQITPGALSGTLNKRFHVNIIGGRSLNDGDLNGVAGLEFRNGGAQTNKVYGEVVVRGFTVDQPKSRGISFREWDADKCPRVIIENTTVYNPDSTLSASTNPNRTGIVIYADSTQTTTNLGNIVLRNCLAEDLRASPRMTWGMVLAADSGKVLKNVLVEDPTSINIVASAKADIHTFVASGAGTSTDVSVTYSKPSIFSVVGSLSIGDYAGKRISVASGNAVTLPLAANCSGMAYEVQTEPGATSVTVALQTGDMIAGLVNVASTSLILDQGGFVRLRSRGGTTWYVEAVAGRVRRPGTGIARQIWWASAAPTSGTWEVGDKVFNQIPSIGQPKGWVCTVAGTPGTWVSEGNL